MSARPRARRRVRAVGVAASLVVAGIAVAACTDSDDPGATSTTAGPTLPFRAPSKTELGDAAGLAFPDAVGEYRSVQLSPNQLDVTFTIAAADLDAFVDGSDLGELVPGERVMAHASPLWELNPDDVVRGAESERDGYRRTVEVVGEGDPLVVRLTIQPV